MDAQGNDRKEKKSAESSRRSFLKGMGMGAAALGGAVACFGGGLPAPATEAEAGETHRTSWECGCTGGPIPHKNSSHVIIRWLGSVNFEICYKGQIFLFSNYYDKGPASLVGTYRVPDLGFAASDVKRATALFLGHAHFDHMSDTAQVASQTGAPVYGHQTVKDKLLTQGTPESQINLIADGDVYKFDGLKVEPCHMYHSGLFTSIMPSASSSQYSALQTAEWSYPALTDEESAAIKAVMAKGSNDSTIQQYGCYGYLFTFKRKFKVFMYDSHNPTLTSEFQALMARIGRVHVGTVGYQGGTAERLTEYVWPVVEAFNAKYLWPCHNDVTVSGREHVATQHVAQFVKNKWPNRHTIISLYREPVCFDVNTCRRIPLEDVDS